MRGMQVQSLVGELRSHMPCSMTKKEEKEEGIVLVIKIGGEVFGDN